MAKKLSYYVGNLPSEGWKKTKSAHDKALNEKKGGHKQNEREVKAKKLGYYPNGHKNFGDVYEK